MKKDSAERKHIIERVMQIAPVLKELHKLGIDYEIVCKEIVVFRIPELKIEHKEL